MSESKYEKYEEASQKGTMEIRVKVWGEVRRRYDAIKKVKGIETVVFLVLA